uniref:P-type ATPase N-terminal domain-containing protein n=1 Tax=Romanomermis culicivorax TaxID=13658 RepID=A0A915J7D5_ROMCU
MKCVMKICKSNNAQPRTLRLGAMNTPPHKQYPRNGVQNRKYNFFTFIPIVLFNQFKFFLNLYFLIMALSQFIPEIRVGYLSTYWGPLGFVLGVTMIREAIDDFRRYMRDREVNSKIYEKVTSYGRKTTKSSRIEVGDLIVVHKDERVPADMVLLRTTEKPGACFIRTDQLDGETDWKLRIATPVTQNLADELCSRVFLYMTHSHMYKRQPIFHLCNLYIAKIGI